MSDFLNRLAERAVGQMPTLQPLAPVWGRGDSSADIDLFETSVDATDVLREEPLAPNVLAPPTPPAAPRPASQPVRPSSATQHVTPPLASERTRHFTDVVQTDVTSTTTVESTKRESATQPVPPQHQSTTSSESAIPVLATPSPSPVSRTPSPARPSPRSPSLRTRSSQSVQRQMSSRESPLLGRTLASEPRSSSRTLALETSAAASERSSLTADTSPESQTPNTVFPQPPAQRHAGRAPQSLEIHEREESQGREDAQQISVNIGRIVIRPPGPAPAAAPTPPAAPATPRDPRVTLAQYLAERNAARSRA